MEQHHDSRPSEGGLSPSPDGGALVPPRAPIQLQLGQIVITPGAMKVLSESEVHRALTRHSGGDWGTVNRDDWKENDLSVKEGFRILSAYRTESGTQFWIITEADRSSTCILLPEEY